MRPRYTFYTIVYGLVYYMGDDLSWAQLFGALVVATGLVLAVHLHLKKGDAEILKKVQASQDRYEYEQERKQKLAKAHAAPNPTSQDAQER